MLQKIFLCFIFTYLFAADCKAASFCFVLMKDDISRRRAKAAALVTVIIQLITTFFPSYLH